MDYDKNSSENKNERSLNKIKSVETREKNFGSSWDKKGRRFMPINKKVPKKENTKKL